MKTKNIKHTETTKLQQNIIITILLQTIGKTSTTIAETKETELLKLLKDILIVANTSIKEKVVYRNLTPTEAENEIEILDNMYKLLSTIFDMLFSRLTKKQSLVIKPEYNKLIDIMEDVREGLELYTDVEFMETMKAVSKGDYSDFIRVA